MADPVEVVGMDELLDYVDELPDRMLSTAKTQYRLAAQRASNAVKDRITDGAGGTLTSRTGQLRRSIQYDVYGGTLDTLGASVFSAEAFASYAPVHELGATIRAKKAYARLPGGPYLHFPIGQNLTPKGAQRMSGAEVFARGAYVAKNKENKRFPYRVVLNEKLMFLLVKQVTIEPRLKMVKTVSDEIPTLLSALKDAAQEAID